jgi:hypothetical protein
MSKHNIKKAERQRKKHQLREQARNRTISSYISPGFPAERIGVPAAGARWIGQMIAPLFRPRKRW